jgi:hypothetical protein
VTIYRYSMRLAAHYDSRADALDLSEALLDDRFHRLVRSLTPLSVDFGKDTRTPIDTALGAMRDIARSRGR